MHADDIPPDDPLNHDGELLMRRRFRSNYHWDAGNLPAMMRASLSASLARFIEAQPFFFIATAGRDGHCDCSFRGREYSAFGQALPALKVLDACQLVFPDFSGNGLYNSLGNIIQNPHIGMLFMDFDRQRRARVNGLARIDLPDAVSQRIWPMAQAVIRVEVEQAYGNCAARIPRLRMVEGSDAGFS